MLAQNFEVVQVQSKADFDALGAFRYRCYLADGLIEQRPDEIFLDEHDTCSTAHVFMILSFGRIVSTIRLHVLNKECHNSATMIAFHDILKPKIEAGLILSDAARFAIDPDLGRLRLLVARQTLRIYEDFAKAHNVDYGVAAVLKTRIEMYNRIYGFRQISEPRCYGALRKSLVLMGVDLRHPALRSFDRI